MVKVIIVEDEDFVRKGLHYSIDWLSLGCVVVAEASNGIEGIELIKETNPDLVITDIKMPMMDGIKMLKSFQEIDFETIIITGHAEFDFAKQAIELGVYDYTLKPINEMKFKATIINIVKRIKDKKVINYVKDIDDVSILKKSLYSKNLDNASKYTTTIVDYIKAQYHSRMSLEDVSDEIGISSTYLSRVFKEDTGITVNDFLNRYRMQQSITLMETTDMKVYEIAEKVGFSDYKYFSRIFKRYLNYSPKEFMKTEIFFIDGEE